MRIAWLFVLLSIWVAPALAQSPDNKPLADGAMASGEMTSGEIRDLDAIVVSGVQPGPGMWKVSSGDHALWILGTQSPLPMKMQWQSRDVEAVLSQAQEVLYSPGVVFDADVGFFGKIALLPSLLGVRKSPDGAVLRDLVPETDYVRWLELKARYIGRDRGIEKWRPLFAAMELSEQAIDKAGLVRSGVIGPVIRAGVKRYKPKVTAPMLTVEIPAPKAVIREFRAESLDDVGCFSKTMQQLEADLGSMTARANAWATGDIEALRGLPRGDQGEACLQAALGAGVARKYGPPDIEAATRALWVQAAESALAGNRVTFATLPMSELLKADGYLEALSAKGYVIEAP